MRRFRPALIVFPLALLLAAQAHATTFMVTNTADTGAGSLRQALINASSDPATPHAIWFDASFPQGGVIELQTALPAWSNSALTIDGRGRAPVLDGRNAVRILTVAAGAVQVTLRELSFRRGRSTSGTGGCVWHSSTVADTSLYVYDSHFESCRAVGNQINANGGAISWVAPGAWVFIRDSTFSGNVGGVIGNSSRKVMSGGAVHVSAHRIEITGSRFSANVLERVGGVVQGLGGAVYASATLSTQLRDVEFRSNRVIDADASGVFSAGGAAALLCLENSCSNNIDRSGFIDNTISGDDVGGGALATQGGTLDLLNASFSSNRAIGNSSFGGAMILLTASAAGASHLSFKDNGAAFGAHLAMSGVDVTRWVWSLHGPVAAGAGAACELDGIQLTGFSMANLFESACAALSASGGSIGPVGPLALDETVFPATLAPGSGSAAIDPPGSQAWCASVDARGLARPQDGDDDGSTRCDVGAYEVPPAKLFADGFDGVP